MCVCRLILWLPSPSFENLCVACGCIYGQSVLAAFFASTQLFYYIYFHFISFCFLHLIQFDVIDSIFIFPSSLNLFIDCTFFEFFILLPERWQWVCVCVVCGVCVSLCAFRSFCHHEDMCDGWMAGFNILLRVFANLTCLRINHMSYDISHYIL